MTAGVKRALYGGLVALAALVVYCVVESPRESLTGLVLLVTGGGLFFLGSVLEERARSIPLLPIAVLVAGFALVTVGLFSVTKPIWRNVLSQNTRLFIAVGDGDNEAAIAILGDHPDLVNTARYVDDYSLLHQAAVGGNLPMAQYLLERGADVAARNVKGQTALDLAQQMKANIQTAPNAGWSLARNADIDGVVALLAGQVATAPSPSPPKGAAGSAGYLMFSRSGLSFEYPSTWQLQDADRSEMMKEALARELQADGVKVLDFAKIDSPDGVASALATRYLRPKPTTPSEVVAERRRVYEDARRAGDVTKVNRLEETSVGGLPGVEEDVERSNGGRGWTLKIIAGSTISEISIVVREGATFARYAEVIGRVRSTARVAAR